MKINKTRRRSNGNISRRKYKNINKSRKRVIKTHKKYLVRLKKYNKNNRHRKYYTRRVNRYKRGGAELQPITTPFNFSFPLSYKSDGKLLVHDNNIPQFTDGYGAENIRILAGGWGYVTKAGLLNRKNRPEQLIVYHPSENSNDYYYIARCNFNNCQIGVKVTESNMEKPIKVSTKGFKVVPVSDSLTVRFETVDNESYTIEVVVLPDNESLTINDIHEVPTLYTFFKTFLNSSDAVADDAVADDAAAAATAKKVADDAAAAVAPVYAPFNFSLPMTVDNKMTDIVSIKYRPEITIVAQGWGYVTKAGSLNRKNRLEQLIVYQKSYHSNNYYIARCTSKDCKISLNTLSKMKMEKPIVVNDAGFSAPKQSGNNLIVEFKTVDNESYTIVVVTSYSTVENLYKFFKYLHGEARGSSTTAYNSSKVAIDNKDDWDPVAANTQIT